MLTPTETQYPIIQWLRWLLVKLGFKPDSWMIDCSDVETAAIRAVHGLAMRIFECLWHVLDAINRRAKDKLSVSTVPKGTSKVVANKALRESATRDFRRLVYAATPEEFEEVWGEICDVYVEQREWMKYLATEWVEPLGKKEKWALCYRKVSRSTLLSTTHDSHPECVALTGLSSLLDQHQQLHRVLASSPQNLLPQALVAAAY